MTDSPVLPPKREWHGSHPEWGYSPTAFRWDEQWIAGVNFIPFATETRKWLQQSGLISGLFEADRSNRRAYRNPYSYSGAAIASMFCRAVNACLDYTASDVGTENETEAEVARIHLSNDVVLYSARLCEVVIKQLLYCTSIPEKNYKGLALGQLLETSCPDCRRKDGKEPHKVSWIGALACPFHLCREFDQCANDHLALVNKLRNVKAAHSDNEGLNPRTVKESKDQLFQESTRLLEGVVHMLTHVEKLEDVMIADLEEKAQQINLLKFGGLPPDECNFYLRPSVKFAHPRLFG